jgi:catechol 2,3-dioxygenase-like lactoylglutathione lyase family enzyme
VNEVVPILRVADGEASAEWYARLGFEVEWRHRFDEGMPLFMSLRGGDWRIFLSEHTGDAPGPAVIYLFADDTDAIAESLGQQAESQPWGLREIELTDPDGNRLRVGSPERE